MPKIAQRRAAAETEGKEEAIGAEQGIVRKKGQTSGISS